MFLIWGCHLRYSRTPRTNSFSKYIVKKLTFFSNFHQTVKANCCAFAATGCRKSYPLLQSSASLKNAGKHCYAARYCTLRISMICLLQSRSRRVSLPFPPREAITRRYGDSKRSRGAGAPLSSPTIALCFVICEPCHRFILRVTSKFAL